MQIYLIMISIIIFLGIIIFYKEKNDKRKKIFLALSFGLMFLIMGFREIGVGTDTVLYTNSFVKYCSQSFSSVLSLDNSALVYALFNKIVSLFSQDPHAILVAGSAITLGLTAKFIYDNSEHVVYSTLLFIVFYHYFSAFNISRQYLAIMIIAYGFKYVKEKKIFKYIICCLLATFTHNTAVIGFFLIPLMYIKFNKTSIIIYSILMSGVMFLIPNLLTLFTSIFTHYQVYFQEYFQTGSTTGTLLMVALYIIIALMAFFFKGKDQEEKAEENREYYILFIINILTILTLLVSTSIPILSRISLYFSIFAIIYIPRIFDKVKFKTILYLFFIIIMAWSMTNKLQSGDSQVVPYQNTIIK